MALTLTQAQQKAQEAGYPQSDWTTEVLKTFGYTAPDPLAGLDPAAPALTDDQVNSDLADAATEAQGNTTGAQVVAGLQTAAQVATQLGAAAIKANPIGAAVGIAGAVIGAVAPVAPAASPAGK